MAQYKTKFTVSFEGYWQGSEFIWSSLQLAQDEFKSVMEWYGDSVLSFSLEKVED